MANSLQDTELEVLVKGEKDVINHPRRKIENISYSFSNTGRSSKQFINFNDGTSSIRWQEIVPEVKDKNTNSAFWYSYLRSAETPPVPTKRRVIKTADLYSGMGGLSLGIKEACISLGLGFNARLAIENEPVTLEVYNSNFNCDYPVSSDITQVIDGSLGESPTEKEIKFVDKVGDIDFVVAGPPCQGFSNLNNHTRRDDERNDLYLKAARFVELFQPDHLIIENVSQVKLDKRGVTEKTIQALNDLGYSNDQAAIDLSKLGVPQKRKRHVIVASKIKEVNISDMISKYYIDKPRSVMWAIDDLQESDSEKLIDDPANVSDTNKLRIQYLHTMNEYKLPLALRPKCHRNYNHSYWSMYGRMYPNKPAQTITGGFYSPGQGRFIHPTQQRTITAHEAARLQFFPDYFDLSMVTTKKGLCKMIGNAAPMKLTYYFGLELLSWSKYS